MKMVTLNLPEPFLMGIDKLVELGLFPNRSEAIRVALHDFLTGEIEFSQEIEKRIPTVSECAPPVPKCTRLAKSKNQEDSDSLPLPIHRQGNEPISAEVRKLFWS